MNVGPSVTWEAAGTVEVASGLLSVEELSEGSGKTPLGISERTSLGIREVKSDGISVRCA